MSALDVSASLSGLAALGLAATLVSTLLAGWRIGRRRVPFLENEDGRAVTIVRPLCGLEPFSQETLGSGFSLAHPDYELIFCVADREDPIIPLVKRLMARHPDVPAQLLVGQDRVSANPKLNNCVKGWGAASSDWVILADSNVLMPPDFIGRMLSAWQPRTGLVCSTPVGTRAQGFWADVECAFLNTLQARWQYASEAAGFGFAQGKSMLWYRPFLDSRGGLRALASDIAEDAAATKLVRAAGLRVHLVDRPFDQPLGRRGMRDVWVRQLRWARLRRVTFPRVFLPEILSSPLLLAAVMALALPNRGAMTALIPAALLAACYGAEFALARRAGWHRSLRLLPALLARDMAVPALWLMAFITRDLVWRGNAMWIPTGSREPLLLDPSEA